MQLATALAAATTLTTTEPTSEPPSTVSPAVDRSERDRLITVHFELVRSIAGALRASPIGSGILFDDLVAYGAHGLLQAAERFDSTKGVPFEIFARYRIRGAMVDGIRRHHWLSRRAYKRLRTEQLLAIGVPANDVHPFPCTSQAPATGSLSLSPNRLDETHNNGSSSHFRTDDLADCFAGDRWNGRQMAQRPVEPDDTMQVRVKAALGHLPEKERRVVELCYFAGMTFEQAGAQLGVRRSWVCRLHTRAIGALRTALDQAPGKTVP
jgi:RNA polymerase sigma factor for flagellar operon FliA